MSQRSIIGILISNIGGIYSQELGIELNLKKSKEIFKWFLASILFGARIGEKIAINTYKEFENNGVLSPRKIIDTGWDGLVEMLDKGGYVRYDFKTATKLLNICDILIKDYGGDLNLLHRLARDEKDLEERFKSLGKGIGDITINIFLRELRDIWEKANPPLQELVILSARRLKFIAEGEDALQGLKIIWEKNRIEGKGIADFEVSLLRLAKNFCKKSKCKLCPVSSVCLETKQG